MTSPIRTDARGDAQTEGATPTSRWAPIAKPARRWRDQRRLGMAVVVLFGVVAATALFRSVALGNRLIVLDDPRASDFLARARGADGLVDAAELALAIAVLVLAPCFITWLWRAAKNQQALGRAPERLGSGWAVGGWFIPLANLVIPVLVVQDLWRGSDAAIAAGDPRWRIADRSWLVGWWWGLFLVPLFTASGADADRLRDGFSEARGANFLALVAMIGLVAAAGLGALVVRRLGARQEECRSAFGVLPPTDRSTDTPEGYMVKVSAEEPP